MIRRPAKMAGSRLLTDGISGAKIGNAIERLTARNSSPLGILTSDSAPLIQSATGLGFGRKVATT